MTVSPSHVDGLSRIDNGTASASTGCNVKQSVDDSRNDLFLVTPYPYPRHTRRLISPRRAPRSFRSNDLDSCSFDVLCGPCYHASRLIPLYSSTKNSSLCIFNWCTQIWISLTAALIGWFIPFNVVLLLPIDLASTSADNICRSDPENCNRPLFYLSERTLLLGWRIGYWTTFALTWFVPPHLA
jgi:LMBR1-like membrane protein